MGSLYPGQDSLSPFASVKVLVMLLCSGFASCFRGRTYGTVCLSGFLEPCVQLQLIQNEMSLATLDRASVLATGICNTARPHLLPFFFSCACMCGVFLLCVLRMLCRCVQVSVEDKAEQGVFLACSSFDGGGVSQMNTEQIS